MERTDTEHKLPSIWSPLGCDHTISMAPNLLENCPGLDYLYDDVKRYQNRHPRNSLYIKWRDYFQNIVPVHFSPCGKHYAKLKSLLHIHECPT